MNAVDHEGDTPLHRAVRRRDPAAITQLIEAGADVNALDHEGDTPLHLAIRCNIPKIVV